MSETVSVNFSGPALAFLLYENVKSRCEQEGFLLGETNVIVTKTITDSDSHNLKEHKIININAVVPCPRTCAFYNNLGEVDTDKLEDILGPEMPNVVAWYKYEPEKRFRLTVREKIIHKSLADCGMFPIPTDLLSCCLLSSTNSHLESTNTYTHTFLRYINRQFVNVPMHIANLGELSNCYKPKVHCSKSFGDLCDSIGVTKNGTFDLKLIDTIQDKLHFEVEKIMSDLSESEYMKMQLEQDYQRMKQQHEFYSNVLAEKMLAAQRTEVKSEKEMLENKILNLIDPDKFNLKTDLTENKIKVKTEHETDDDTSSENLIDLTTEEERSRPTRKSYAQIMKN